MIVYLKGTNKVHIYIYIYTDEEGVAVDKLWIAIFCKG